MYIDTKRIIDISATYKSIMENLKDEQKKISSSLNTLQYNWKGEKASKYFDAINAYLVELRDAIDLLNKYYDYLHKVSTAYEKIDNSYMNKKII